VIEPGPGRVGQVNGEELDDEGVIIHPACPARKMVVNQPNAGIGFSVVFDDVIWCPKSFWETSIMHFAPEHLRPWPFRAEVAPFSIVASTAVQVAHAVLRMHPLIPTVSMSVRWRLRASTQVAQTEIGWGPHR
jgi:hypothetical protein